MLIAGYTKCCQSVACFSVFSVFYNSHGQSVCAAELLLYFNHVYVCGTVCITVFMYDINYYYSYYILLFMLLTGMLTLCVSYMCYIVCRTATLLCLLRHVTDTKELLTVCWQQELTEISRIL